MRRRTVATPRSEPFSVQSRGCFYRKNVYRNRFSEFFFTEFDKGFKSLYLTAAFFTAVGAATYYTFYKWFVPNVEAGRLKAAAGYQLRLPFADSHNAFWNFRPAAVDVRHPASLTMLDEEIVRQPGLIASVDSEIEDPKSGKKTIFVMEVQELDPKHNDDVFYRSVHYVNKSEITPVGVGEGENQAQKKKLRRATLPMGVFDEEQENHMHAMVKCRTVTADNQCVPETQAVHEEITRKLLLSLIPAHYLRDAWKVQFPFRFSLARQVESRVLVCGLRGGVLARTMATAFPQFKVDVCEVDGGLVKVNRQFLGLKESNNFTMFISDYQTYFKECLFKGIRYDLIILDCVDSRGRIPSYLGRLEFLSNLRKVMGDQGAVVLNLPNSRRKELTTMIDNWRIAFANQPIVMIHCKHDRNTVVMAFNEYKSFGMQIMGSLPNAATLKHMYLSQRDQFNRSIDIDFNAEVDEDNFQCIEPHQQQYDFKLRFPNEPTIPSDSDARAAAASGSTLQQQQQQQPGTQAPPIKSAAALSIDPTSLPAYSPESAKALKDVSEAKRGFWGSLFGKIGLGGSKQ